MFEYRENVIWGSGKKTAGSCWNGRTRSTTFGRRSPARRAARFDGTTLANTNKPAGRIRGKIRGGAIPQPQNPGQPGLELNSGDATPTLASPDGATRDARFSLRVIPTLRDDRNGAGRIMGDRTSRAAPYSRARCTPGPHCVSPNSLILRYSVRSPIPSIVAAASRFPSVISRARSM